jgi:hypothetical protein
MRSGRPDARLAEIPAASISPRNIARVALLALAASWLAACQVPTQAGPSGAQAGPASAAPPSSGVAQSHPLQAPAVQSAAVQINPAADPGKHGAAAAIIPAATRSDTPIGPSHLTGDPSELVGLDNAAVLRALGDPQWIRKEMPAQVWQYATADCIVDLYLYDRNGALKVTFVEARSHKAEAEPTARCLKSLLERPTASAN